MVIPKALANKIASAPQVPGVYIFKDAIGNILYLGKAVHLKKRLLYYAKPEEELYAKTAQFLKQAAKLSWIEVASDLEAILLEVNLIRTLKPKYNIISKDDKRPLLIQFTNDPLPRVRTARVEIPGTGDYIGPFPSSYKLKLILRRLRRIFPYCSCTPKRRYPCLFVDLGLCKPCPVVIQRHPRGLPGYQPRSTDRTPLDLPVTQRDPIVSTITPGLQDDVYLTRTYRRNIHRLKLFLQGKIKTVQKQLEKEMKQFSQNLEFEKAHEIKLQLEAIDQLLTQPQEISQYLSDNNISDHLRAKQLESLRDFLIRLEALSTSEITTQEGHPRKSVLNLRESNANQIETASNQDLFTSSILRIECYDIANTSGTNATAAMTVFENGLPNTSEYRKFKITQVQGPNDPLMMQHVLERRLRHPEWPYPQLFLIDGGKTQVAAAIKAIRNHIQKSGVSSQKPEESEKLTVNSEKLKRKNNDREKQSNKTLNTKCQILNTPPPYTLNPNPYPLVLGLAKQREELVIPINNGFKIVRLPLDTPFLTLLRAVRDEAHRFGTTYHKLLRQKKMFQK